MTCPKSPIFLTDDSGTCTNKKSLKLPAEMAIVIPFCAEMFLPLYVAEVILDRAMIHHR